MGAYVKDIQLATVTVYAVIDEFAEINRHVNTAYVSVYTPLVLYSLFI